MTLTYVMTLLATSVCLHDAGSPHCGTGDSADMLIRVLELEESHGEAKNPHH